MGRYREGLCTTARWSVSRLISSEGRNFDTSADGAAPTGYDASSLKKKQKHRAADFTEAWVEFLDKSIAKTVAGMLNAEVIGGKKGDRSAFTPWEGG